MTVTRASIFVIILVGVFIAYRFTQTSPDSIEQVRSSVESLVRPAPQTPALQTEAPVALVTVDEESCLTDRQIEEHPLIAQDAYRLMSVSVGGPDIEPYRGMDLQSLQEFARQGDSAAMSVMGASAVMRALDLDESSAVSWLQMEIPKQTLFERQFSPEAMLELNDAANWFYESALNGRLYALGKYGEIHGVIFGGAVGLGWITADEYEKLDSEGKTILDPFNVYQALAGDIAPALKDGVLGAMFNMVPENDLQQSIRAELQQEFSGAIADAELPEINVPPAASADFEEILLRRCGALSDN